MVAVALAEELSVEDIERLAYCLNGDGLYEPWGEEVRPWQRLEVEGYVRIFKDPHRFPGGLFYTLTGIGKRLAEEAKRLTMLSPIPKYGDLMTLEEFANGVETASLTDYDGWGRLATANKTSNIEVLPSTFSAMKVDAMFTHVVWYNK